MSKIELHGLIHRSEQVVKHLVLAILMTLTLGYSVGMRYLYITSDFATQGVEENYLGNERDDDAEEMKFKMPEAKLLTVIHSHLISYALIFSLLGIILLISSVPRKLKNILILEPFILSVITFGGLYFLWAGYALALPFVMVSGALLSLGFYVTVGLLVVDLFRMRK